MKTLDGVTFNFDRILRVTVAAGQGKNISSQVIEYCPMADERLNPRIDTTIKCMPITVNKHNKPGFSAKVTIYNPPQSLLTMINQHVTWPIGKKTQAAYYAGRCRVSIDAGYWNPDSSNPRDYYSLGDFWLNSSAYYRKGADNILDLWCHELKLTDEDIQKMTRAVDVKKRGYSDAVVVDVRNRELVGDEHKVWGTMLQTLIRLEAPRKAPLIKEVVLSEERQASIMTTVPTSADREARSKFFVIKYIQQPKDYNNPEDGLVPDYDLEDLACGGAGGWQGLSTRGLVLNGKTFYEKMQQMLDFFPEPIVYKEDLTNTDGISRYYIWRPRKDDGGYSANAKLKDLPTIKAPIGDIITIYNFQNMLQVPSVDGSGCFTAKMLFNPNMRPPKWLRLAWVDDFRLGTAISPYTEGVNTSASFANYYPTLQGGKYQAQVYALSRDKENLGYLFNRDYRIGYVTHTLSTYSSNWTTEVKTLSIMGGG